MNNESCFIYNNEKVILNKIIRINILNLPIDKCHFYQQLKKDDAFTFD